MIVCYIMPHGAHYLCNYYFYTINLGTGLVFHTRGKLDTTYLCSIYLPICIVPRASLSWVTDYVDYCGGNFSIRCSSTTLSINIYETIGKINSFRHTIMELGNRTRQWNQTIELLQTSRNKSQASLKITVFMNIQ